MPIEEKVAQHLLACRKTIAVAESCTGGLLANRLTNVPGSSNFFKLGLVTYSNEAKAKLLGIPQKMLKAHGAVSEQTATAMAERARRIFQTDFGLGITGIAGPEGGTKAKPVGLTFIAINTKLETLCLKCQFQGIRTKIKQQAASKALELLYEFLT